MRKPLILVAAAAVLALPAALAFTPTPAAASCDGRKNTGMVLGGLGGALVGNAVSRGDGGTIVGGLAGGVIGHQVAKSGCAENRRVVYRNAPRRAASASAPARAVAPPPVRKVYYDQYGNPVGQAFGPQGYANSAYATR